METDQKASSKYIHSYAAMEMMVPKEKRMANLAGLPAARLMKEPKDRIWIRYPM